MKSLMLLISGLVFSFQASAGLILDISDNGGYAHLALSGSDTVASGSSGINGFWVHGATVTSMFAVPVPAAGAYAVTGTGEITNSGYGSQSIYDLYLNIGNSCCNFGLRNGNGGTLSTGDAISWSGDLDTNLLFSAFNTGTYTFTQLTAFSNSGSVLADGITINVGPVSGVPEVPSVAILMLGLMGLALRARKA